MFGDVLEGLLESIGWGIGGAVIAATVLVGGPRAKPLAKGAIKGYFAATQRVRELTAEASESFQDLYAEAKHEYESQLTGEPASEAEPEEPPSRRASSVRNREPA